jgi:hypothetical protein
MIVDCRKCGAKAERELFFCSRCGINLSIQIESWEATRSPARATQKLKSLRAIAEELASTGFAMTKTAQGEQARWSAVEQRLRPPFVPIFAPSISDRASASSSPQS